MVSQCCVLKKSLKIQKRKSFDHTVQDNNSQINSEP